MEIEIGEYVRTKDGYIAKAVERDTTNWLFFDNSIKKLLRLSNFLVFTSSISYFKSIFHFREISIFNVIPIGTRTTENN